MKNKDKIADYIQKLPVGTNITYKDPDNCRQNCSDIKARFTKMSSNTWECVLVEKPFPTSVMVMRTRSQQFVASGNEVVSFLMEYGRRWYNLKRTEPDEFDSIFGIIVPCKYVEDI